ncbi:hypothetical protein D9M70_612610 [compost metagenome]
MGLARAVVRVLADDDDLDLVQRRGIERVEDQRSGRIDHLAGGLLRAEEFAKFLHVGLVKLLAQSFLPTRFQFDTIVARVHGTPDGIWPPHPKKAYPPCQSSVP